MLCAGGCRRVCRTESCDGFGGAMCYFLDCTLAAAIYCGEGSENAILSSRMDRFWTGRHGFPVSFLPLSIDRVLRSVPVQYPRVKISLFGRLCWELSENAIYRWMDRVCCFLTDETRHCFFVSLGSLSLLLFLPFRLIDCVFRSVSAQYPRVKISLFGRLCWEWPENTIV